MDNNWMVIIHEDFTEDPTGRSVIERHIVNKIRKLFDGDNYFVYKDCLSSDYFL